MMGVAFSAFILWTLGAQLFLMLIAVFSFYLAFSGYRAVKLKNHPPQEEDWLVAGAAFIAGLGLIGMGLYNKIQGDSFGIVAIVFGAGCTFDATRDMLRFSRPITDQRAWLITHLTKMLGAYIATVSAVSAVNFQFLPPVWRWLWPTIIIGPMIFMWVQKYRSRTIENIKTPT